MEMTKLGQMTISVKPGINNVHKIKKSFQKNRNARALCKALYN